MVMRSLKEILLSYPCLIPAVLVLLGIMCLLYACYGITSLFKGGNCPSCPYKKRFCLVACDEVARRLNEMENEQERVNG